MPEENLQSLDREQRLDEAVTAFLEEQESGRRPQREEWLARYPEVAAELQQFFADQDEVDRLTSPLRTALHITPSPEDTPNLGLLDGAPFPLSPSALATSPLRHSATPPEGYELLQVLGQGGMGLVYKARQKSAGRLVALKLIRAERLTSEADVQRFRNEAEAAAQLDHPHIVPVYEVSARSGHFFFSMKLIEGGGLDEQLERFRDDLPGAARLVAQVARAVHHAHQRGILHRDLKPSNILLDQEGQPHVSDFGLAKRIESDSSLTQTGAILGTPQYIAPEQTSGRKGVVTTATDVYGLGAVLYALLTGRPPFRGETVLETLEQVRQREPEPPRRLNAKVDRDLETICLKCLEKEPAKRYSSADALAEDLEHWLRGEPIQARRIGWGQRIWRWCRRNPTPAVVSGVAIACLLSTTVVSLLFAVRETQNAKDLGEALAASETNRRRAERRLAENYLDRGLTLCEQGEIGVGLLWMVRAMETASEDATDLQWAIRVNLAGWSRQLHTLRAVLEHQGPGVLEHPGPVLAAFSSDGRIIFTGSQDASLRTWEPETGEPLDKTSLRSTDEIWTRAFSSDARTLATTQGGGWYVPLGGFTTPGNRDLRTRGTAVQLWDGTTGQPLRSLDPPEQRVYSLTFSPDGQVLATGNANRIARLWNVGTGKLLGETLPHSDTLLALAFSPDGRTLATACGDPMVRFWDAATGKPRRNVRLPARDGIWVFAFSPDGRSILAGTSDHQALLCDAASGKALLPPLRHRNLVSAVAFDREGQFLVTGCYDKTARLWDRETGQPLGQPLPYPDYVETVAFRPDGRSVLVAGWEGSVRLWNVAPREDPGLRFRHTAKVGRLHLSRDGRFLLVAEEDGSLLRLWEAGTARPVGPALRNPEQLRAESLCADGQAALTYSAAGVIRRWDLAKANLAGQAAVFDHPVMGAAFSPNGRFLETQGGDNIGRIFETATGKTVSETSPHDGRIWAVAFSRDERLLVTGSEDRTARIWEVATGQRAGPILAHNAPVRAVALSPDGRMVLTATSDGVLHRWDWLTGESLGQPLPPRREGGAESSFSPDGRIVLTVYGDGMAQLRDVLTGISLGAPLRYSGRIDYMVFSPDGQSVFARDIDDHSARAWEVPAPVDGSVEQLACWLEGVTGLKLDDDGMARALDAAAWRQRRRRLEELGGPP